jgi:hypothetical protein
LPEQQVQLLLELPVPPGLPALPELPELPELLLLPVLSLQSSLSSAYPALTTDLPSLRVRNPD